MRGKGGGERRGGCGGCGGWGLGFGMGGWGLVWGGLGRVGMGRGWERGGEWGYGICLECMIESGMD